MSRNPKIPQSRKKTKTPGSTGGGKNPQPTHLDYYPIIAAWRNDFWRIVDQMAPHISDNRTKHLPPIDEGSYLDLMQKRIELALEYTILDSHEFHEDYEVIRSFEHGRELVSDLVLKVILKNPDEEILSGRIPGNLKEKLIKIHACMIALIIRGEVGSAIELARMTEGFLWIFFHPENEYLLKPQFNKKAGPDKNRLKLLIYLASCIQIGSLPTKKTLRIEVFGVNMDDANFSRLLKELEILKFIPPETKARKKNGYSPTFHQVGPPIHNSGISNIYKTLAGLKKTDRERELPMVDVEPETPPYFSIRPSSDPDMAHCEIRRIRESLGAAYWQLLLQFGMGELESHEDLQVFVERLAGIGLELK